MQLSYQLKKSLIPYYLLSCKNMNTLRDANIAFYIKTCNANWFDSYKLAFQKCYQ